MEGKKVCWSTRKEDTAEEREGVSSGELRFFDEWLTPLKLCGV